jgi:hypothetical protein
VSAAQRDKGARAEREVVAIFRDAGWPDAKRTHDGNAQVGRGDIAGGPAGFHVEVKRHERLSVPAAFRQIRRDAPEGFYPLLVHRPSREVWMATLELRTLLVLLKRADISTRGSL